MSRVIICTGCRGTGAIKCPICDGKGFIRKRGILGEMGLGEREDCQECQGTGKILCNLCGGVGKLRSEDSRRSGR